jgi:hypothetical protein
MQFLKTLFAQVLEEHPSARKVVCQWYQTVHGSDNARDELKELLPKLARSIFQKYFLFVGLYNLVEDAFAHVMGFIDAALRWPATLVSS